MSAHAKIDQIDKVILKKLLKDARFNLSEIAKKCNLSTTSIFKRFEKMKKNGIINGTTIILDLTEEHKEFALAITIGSDPKFEEQIIKEIKKNPKILDCSPIIGNYDLFAAAFIQDYEEMATIRDYIKKIPGVLSVGFTANLDRDFYFSQNLIW